MKTPHRQTGTVRDTDEFDPLAPTMNVQPCLPNVRVRQAEIGARVRPNNSRISVPDESDGPISFQTRIESNSPSDLMPEMDPYEAVFDQTFTE